jgi:hypothetical protein
MRIHFSTLLPPNVAAFLTLLLLCAHTALARPALAEPPQNPPPPNKCQCGPLSFDVDIIHYKPSKKIGSVQQYEGKQETVQVSGNSVPGEQSAKDTPQKIAPKNLGPTKAGDRVGIALSNFKAECPCMEGREKTGDCTAYPLPEGALTAASLEAHVKRIADLQKKIAAKQAEVDTAKAKIGRLEVKAAQTTSAQEKKKIETEIKKLRTELGKLEGQIKELTGQLPSGPPTVLDEKFKPGKGTWDDKGNYNAGEFDVPKPPFKHEFVVGYVCVSAACGKATVCYKKFVVEF